MPEQKLTREEVMEMIASMKSNGNGSIKTVWELIYKSGMTWGPLAVIVGVMLWMAIDLFPRYVDANIETQKSLTQNLDRQTKNIEAQTDNLTAQTEAIQEVRDSVKQMTTDSASVVEFTQQATKEHQNQSTQHQAIVSALEAISSKLGE